MTLLQVGTRGSQLALCQTRWVCQQLVAARPGTTIEEMIITTHGDTASDEPFSRQMPVGLFVSALENALLEQRIDFAVHSFKDLQTAVTGGLIVAAVPEREVAHDVLLTREPVDVDRLPTGFRIGTSSPRRAAQFRRLGRVEVVPIRGNVPTRVRKLESGDLDGVVLAAAGLRRLGISHPHWTDLPVDWFVPAPAQGALAVQVRGGDAAEAVVRVLDHPPSRQAVEAERSFLRAVSAGCHAPVAALCRFQDGNLTLHGQLFSDDGTRMVEGLDSGQEPEAIGRSLARRLLQELGGAA